MPLRAHCAKLRRQARGACRKGSRYFEECACSLEDVDEKRAHEEETERASQALEAEEDKRDADLDDVLSSWGFGMMGV